MNPLSRQWVGMSIGAMALAFGLAVPAVADDESVRAAAASETWKLLVGRESWFLASTTSPPPGPVDQWNLMPVSFGVDHSKLVFRGEHPAHGPVMYEVTITDDGFSWVSAFTGLTVMTRDPQDPEHPFKGSAGGYTYMLVCK
jgi:hypothetical protein